MRRMRQRACMLIKILLKSSMHACAYFNLKVYQYNLPVYAHTNLAILKYSEGLRRHADGRNLDLTSLSRASC